MSFGFPEAFAVQPSMGWGNPFAQSSSKPLPNGWQNDEARKKLYGIELAKHSNAFQAACELFEDTSQALWASHNWINDPIVIASKDAHKSSNDEDLLDKDALARKLLRFADERDHTGKFYIVEAKDRLAALKLYAEVQGFIGKIDINASTNTFTNNVMSIRLVKPEPQQDNKIIEHDSEPVMENSLPKIKLVSAR